MAPETIPIKPHSWFIRCLIIDIESQTGLSCVVCVPKHSTAACTPSCFLFSIQTNSGHIWRHLCVCAHACTVCVIITWTVQSVFCVRECSILCVAAAGHHRVTSVPLQHLQIWGQPAVVERARSHDAYPHPPYLATPSPWPFLSSSSFTRVEVSWWIGSDSMWPTTQLFNVQLFPPHTPAYSCDRATLLRTPSICKPPVLLNTWHGGNMQETFAYIFFWGLYVTVFTMSLNHCYSFSCGIIFIY